VSASLYSIPIAFGQCRQWVERNLPGRRVVDAVSTARAAIMAAEDPTGAAVGHEAWVAVACCAGILVASFAAASWLFRHRTAA